MTLHVTHGDSAAHSLRRLGIGPVIVRRDLLTIGPCRADPVAHRAARMRHWGIGDEEASEGLIGVRDLERWLPGSGTLVVWTSIAWSDRLYTFCLLDALERLAFDRNRIVIAEAKTPGLHWSLGAATDEALHAALASAARPPADAIDAAVSIWAAFVSPDPRVFQAACSAGLATYPELADASRGYFAWFPLRLPAGVGLSDVDASMLRWVGPNWKSREALLRAREPVQEVFLWVGNTSVWARLDAWTSDGAVEQRGSEWRLSPAGEALLSQGAGTVDRFPAVSIGGCRIHDAADPWMRDGANVVRG